MLKDEIETNKKVDIILSALSERYQSLHKIRERVQSIGIWYLGITIGICGWILKEDTVLNDIQKFFYIFLVLVTFVAIRFFYLRDLCKGFRSQQKTVAELETVLGLYEKNYFKEGKSMYPDSWKKAGKNDGDGKFFNTTYLLLYLGAITLIFVILFSNLLNNTLKKDYNLHFKSPHSKALYYSR